MNTILTSFNSHDMEIKERFDTFIRHKGLSRRKFQDAIGVSNSYIQNISKGISSDVLNRISIQYPELNTNWLLTGIGEMLSQDNNGNCTPHYEELASKAIPHIDIVTASCGLPNGFNSAIMKGDCERYVIPDMPGCDFTIRAGGRSMINRNVPERSINDRDIVGCRIVRSRSHIRWGEVYALATYDGIMIKKIEQSEQEGYITCVPFNKDEGYKPYDVPINEVYDWALVVGVVSVKTWI